MKQVLYIVCSFVFALICSCGHNKNESLWRIQKDGLYGFIDSLGNVIIEPQYKYVSQFNKDGFAYIISDIKVKEDKRVTIKINENNVDSCIIVKYGYINRQNELVIDTTNNLYIPFTSLYEWGDKALVDFANDYINGKLGFNTNILDKLSFSDGLYLFQDDNNHLFGYKNAKGEIKVAANFMMGDCFQNGRAIVKRGFDSIDFSDRFKRMNSSCVIDVEGNIIASEYFIINRYLRNGLTWAMAISIDTNDKSINQDWVQIDKMGNIKAGPVPNVARVYNNDKYPICQINMSFFGTFYTFLDDNGEFLSDFNHDNEVSISFNKDERNELFSDVIRFSEGYAGIKGQNQKGESAWLFVDSKLEPISQPYDSILPFSEGLAAVKELTFFRDTPTGLGNWGFVKKDDFGLGVVEAIPFSYSECKSFRGCLAYFMNRGASFNVEGYINKKGEIVWQTRRMK